MILYVTVHNDIVTISQAVGVGENVIGDVFDYVEPGETVHGVSYEEYLAHGSGVMEIPDGPDRLRS